MKNNLRTVNVIVSGRIPLKENLSIKDYKKLVDRFNWNFFETNVGTPRYSKRFYIRDKEEISVRHQKKAPYVTLFHKGGIIMVGLKNKKEADIIYDLIINELKKVCPMKL